MLSEIFCARLPRLVSPHVLCRIRGAISDSNLANSNLANSNSANSNSANSKLVGGNPG